MTLIAWILVVFVAGLGIIALCACVLGARREREARKAGEIGEYGELCRLKRQMDEADKACDAAMDLFYVAYDKLEAGSGYKPFLLLLFDARQYIYTRAMNRCGKAYIAYHNAGGDCMEDDAA